MRITETPPSNVVADGIGVASPGQTSAERLRILLAIPLYPPIVGGAEVHVSRLAAALLKRGHDVRVLTTYAPPMPAKSHWKDPNGVDVSCIGVNLPEILRPRAYVAAVFTHIVAHAPRYDMVQLFLTGLHNVSGLCAARLRGIPSAIMFGGSSAIPQLRLLRFGRLQLAAIRRLADRVVVLNDEMRHDFVDTGIEESRIAWLPCSVDASAFRPPTRTERATHRATLRIDPAAFVVAFVGRLHPTKNLTVLLRAVGALARNGRSVALLLVGNGPERRMLKRVALEVCPPGVVRFLGERSGAEVIAALQSADAFAMVSCVEGIPCALIEAMAAGLPCVVSDIPALGQLVDPGVHGFRVPVDDVQGVADALARLANDPGLRHRLGVRARARAVADYGSDLIAQRHEALYRAARSHHQSRRAASAPHDVGR